ncbi:MAG TPA: trypsin-like peptidase domain-containing protein [Ramlibacter sp.]
MNDDLASPSQTVQQGTATSPAGASVPKDVLDAAWGKSQAKPVTRIPFPPPRSGQSSFGEVEGDAATRLPKITGTESDASGHQEVGVDAGESGEEYVEATEAEMSAAAAESGEESALADLRSLEGYVEPRATGEAGVLRDAGDEGQEFLPLLTALVPTLVSAAGPMVARAVAGKLSGRAQNVIRQIARRPGSAVSVAGRVVKAATGASGVLPVLAKLFESALDKADGESSPGEAALNEEFITEAAAAMEVIIGIDQRVPITNTTDVPWRRICALRITFPSGSTYRGTGFLIGPRAVATAGHCVYMKSQGGWARRIEVIPGSNGTKRPFGQVQATTFRSVGGWVNQGLPECDYGCIFVPQGSFNGFNLGSFGVAAFDAQTLVAQPAVLAGYPGDKPFAEMWGMAEVIKAVTAKTLVYQIDTMGGQSGAPVYVKRGGTRYVVGIHNYGAQAGNSATRITQPVYDRLNAWKNL